ncbi:MAG: hypothetical protein Q9211_005916 [Gyalolechia sp. 1 TL-2023]
MPPKGNPNPFQGLPGDVPAQDSSSAAAGRIPSSSRHQAGSAPPSVADLANASPPIASPASSAQHNPRKRPAPPSGVRYTPEFVAKRIKDLKAAQAATPSVAGNTDQTTVTSDPAAASPVTGPAADEGEPMNVVRKEPFPFTSIPRRGVKVKCAVSIDGAPAMGSPVSWPHGFSFQLLLDAGAMGDPLLSIILRVPKENYEGPCNGDKPHEFASMTWRPGKSTLQGPYEIVNNEELSFEEYKNLFPGRGRITESFNDRLGEDASKVRTLVVGVCGGRRYSTADKNRLLAPFGAGEKALLSGLFSGDPTCLTFFYAPPANQYSKCFPAFQRCVSERLRFYHQYRDSETGMFNLNSIRGTPSIKEVGGGMYEIGHNQYRQFDIQENLEDLDKFMVCCALTPIREGQFKIAQMIRLKGEVAECFVYQPPILFGKESVVEAGELSRQQRSFNHWVLLFVRLPSKDKSEIIPDHGATVNVAWYSEMGIFSGRKPKEYNGVVVTRPVADFSTTRTDFCICLFMPQGSGPPRRRQLADLPQLDKARITVTHNMNPMQRELDAVHKIWNSRREEPISLLRTLVWPNPPATRTIIDLSKGPNADESKETVQVTKAEFSKAATEIKKHLNEGQRQVIDGLTKIQNRYMAVAGPSGTGKTKTLQHVITLCLISGHQVLLSAPSNAAVDHGIKNLYESRAPGIQGKKILRLEIQSIEKNHILSEAIKQADAQTKKGAADDDMEVDTQSSDANPIMQRAFDFLLAEHLNDVAQWEKYSSWAANFADMSATIEHAQNFRNPERHVGVPYECTLGFHIRRLCGQDLQEATMADAQARKDTKPDEQDNLPTIAERNRSASYLKWQDVFVEQEGQLRGENAKHYFSARREMEQRVIKDVDCLGTTLNNAGSEFASVGYNPSIICIDEAGQASFPGFYVPMVAFPAWEALLMFGDPQQLTPTILARSFSEVATMAKISPLEFAYKNKRNLYLLTEQFRMAEAIYRFPNDQFYSGRLTCHPDALQDNDTRRAVRRVSTQYGIGGPEANKGSEYFFLDVVNGAARVEAFGTSLLNYANADAIHELIGRLLEEGIPSDSILVLSIYKAQLKHLILTLRPTADGEKQYNLISTVDSFQGGESPVVILDTVVAKDFPDYVAKQTRADGADDGAEPQSGHKYGTVTAFSRDPHRLCVALTRAMDGCIVVGQQTLLLQTLKRSKDATYNTLSRMVLDAHKRNLISTDLAHIDTHPSAIKERQEMTKTQADAKAKNLSEINRFSFIQQHISWGHQLTSNEQEAGQGSIFGTKVEAGPRPDPQEVNAAKKGKNKPKGKK